VWSHCMFCNQSLGQNEVIETFPVGRRLAFHQDRGRLWVICRGCERWNLSPIEERWEAIEECERAFHDTRMKVSTDNIGMARLHEGLELIRIGEPQRPEFAAWRYGDQFGRRRKKAIVVGAAAAGVIGVVAVAGVVTGAVSGAVLGQFGNFYNIYTQNRTVARLRTADGTLLKVKGHQLERASFHRREEGAGFDVQVHHTGGEMLFTGEQAERMAGRVMARVNRSGGKKATIQDAVRRIEMANHPEAFLRSTIETHGTSPALASGGDFPSIGPFGGVSKSEKKKKVPAKDIPGSIARLDNPTRLAVEMAIHEEQERRALEGELFLLQQAWKDAEEIAGISDTLLLPEGTEEALQRLRERAG
jgi:hypothetical protein